MLKLYNTLTRKKETFKPIKKGEVGMYSCGPTVYWYQHIGNLRTYIFSDILKRVLLYDGYKVKHVMNVTDVGHLTSDADTGKDKMEEAAKREDKTVWEVADFYTKDFFKATEKLNISNADVTCKATDHILEMIELIKKLEKNGYTYETNQAVYYDATKFKSYTKLSRQKLGEKKTGAREEVIVDPAKKHPVDFALWFKRVGHFANHTMHWDSPWGDGFPGWHIECSAMSMKYLGETIDIHTGGEDHISIHHTNEIAQSEAATGKKFVNYWLHGAFLTFKGEKVSKSKGGLYTVNELEEMDYKALSYRYLCLLSHYRSQMNFSIENLKNAQNAYERLKNICAELKDDGKINSKYMKEFEKAMNDNLDMPRAIQVLWAMLRDEKAEGKFQAIDKMDSIFGLDLLKKEEIKIPEEVKKLVDEREKARKGKAWKKSDELRGKIRKKGFYVDDTPEGPRLRKV